MGEAGDRSNLRPASQSSPYITKGTSEGLQKPDQRPLFGEFSNRVPAATSKLSVVVIQSALSTGNGDNRLFHGCIYNQAQTHTHTMHLFINFGNFQSGIFLSHHGQPPQAISVLLGSQDLAHRSAAQTNTLKKEKAREMLLYVLVGLTRIKTIAKLHSVS